MPGAKPPTSSEPSGCDGDGGWAEVGGAEVGEALHLRDVDGAAAVSTLFGAGAGGGRWVG